MAKVTIIGGHGKVALLAAPMLVADGHEVTSVFRNPDHTMDVVATEALAIAADVETMDTTALTELFQGQDVVVWSAGAGGGDPARTYAVDRDAAIRSMDAAAAAGARRYVMVSYLGARLDHGISPDNSFYDYAEAKAAADEHLRRSNLLWTILMPSTLTDHPAHERLDPNPSGSADTARALVAEVIRAVVNAKPETVARCEVPFTDGDTPIEEAIAALRPAR